MQRESNGAAMAGTLQLSEQMDGGVIMALFPDRGNRYLSTTRFRSVCAKCPP